MNAKIQELAEQCTIYYDGQEGLLMKHIKSFDKTKFAELIIEECARIAAQTPCPYEDEFAKQTYGHTWDIACVESAKEIRLHFGIKE